MKAPLTRRAFVAFLPLLGAACAPAATSPPASAPPAKPVATNPAAKPAAQQPAPATAPAKPAATQAPATPVQLQKAKIGLIEGVLENAYTLLAKEKGYFREHGVDPEFVDFQGATTVINGLVSGEIDAAHNSNHYAAVEQGADIKMIGFSKPKLSYALYARKEYTKVEDLIAKNIGSSQSGSITHVIMVALLEAKGLDPTGVNFVNIGASPLVFKAVVAGKVDAGPAGAEFIPAAEADPNLRVLLNFAEVLPKYGQQALVTSDRQIAKRPEVVQGIVNAWSKSYRYALEHRDESIEYAAKLFSKSKEEVAFGYDYGRKLRILGPELTINPDQIEYMQQMLVKFEQMRAVLPFERVADARFQKKMMETLGPFKWPA